MTADAWWEGIELIVVLIAMFLAIGVTWWIQKWSGLT